ncbi:MAG TPA: benzoate-CoA ligase family protein [Candidatus Acidoferrales bacterium]
MAAGIEASKQFNIADEFVSRPAAEHPDKTAILGLGHPYTYAELQAYVIRTAQALRLAGCQPGDRVLIVLPDSPEFVAAFFGAAKIGAIAVPVNPHARASDYRHYVANCGARIAIVHSSTVGEFAAEAPTKALDLLVIVDPESDTPRPERIARKIVALDDWLPSKSGDVQTHPTRASDVAFFLYTSGSAGAAKAAVHRHGDMLVTSRNFAEGVLGLRPDDRLYSVSKLYFAYGLGNGMYFPLFFGASTILNPERPNATEIADTINRYKPTVFFSVPTFYATLLREADRGLNVDFSSVRLAVSAGEALPPEVFERFRSRFGIEILDGIGSTEMLHVFLSARPGKAQPGSCGHEVPGYEVKIVDDAGAAVADGEVGNLWAKGDSAFAEYWQLSDATARAKRDGWVITGDKFTRDGDGQFHYCGRSDDMMKVAGMWVSPGEVENALMGHPAVSECAVVGQTDAVGLVKPVAYIVLRPSVVRPGGGLDSEIHGWLRTRMPGFKCPHDFRFVSELPKTSTGKIQRYLLRSS